MQATWSDTNFGKSDSMTSKDERYEQNDYLDFIVPIDSKHETSSECEYTNEQNASFLRNIIVEYQNLIEQYLKTHDDHDSP